MKYLVVEYPDTVDTSTIAIDAAANVVAGAVTITGGKLVANVVTGNPPAPSLIAHTHTTPGGTGSVAIPAGSMTLPAGTSGPAVKT